MAAPFHKKFRNPYSPSTIKISKLPYSFTKLQLEEIFSEVGPVKRCFLVTKKGSTEHCGFGYVQFAVTEDANRAIELKNGSNVGGRKIVVMRAMKRASLEQRRSRIKQEKVAEKSDADESASEDFEETGKETDDLQEVSTMRKDLVEKEDAIETEFNVEDEVDKAKKVIDKLLASSAVKTEVPAGINVRSILPASNGYIKPVKDTKKTEDTIKPSRASKSSIKHVESKEELEKTLFIHNLPFDLEIGEVKQCFARFGEVQSFVPVLDSITRRPKRTGFLKFKSPDAVELAVTAANAGPGLGIFYKGRQLTVLKAVDKESAHNKKLQKTKVQDFRNLYLAEEGLIEEGTAADEGVSATDMAKRKQLHKRKLAKLVSPNFHVSRTRLIIYNVPKSMKDFELKKLCINAVTSYATKQKPVIRQIKLLANKGKSPSTHSRGVAFVEFSNHRHALVALRVLNNNPETFGKKNRPIVEFALDYVKTLMIRNEKLKARENRNFRTSANSSTREDGSNSLEASIANRHNKSRKRKSRDEKTQSRSSGVSEDTNSGTFPSPYEENENSRQNKKRRRNNKKEQANNSLNSKKQEHTTANARKVINPNRQQQQQRPKQQMKRKLEHSAGQANREESFKNERRKAKRNKNSGSVKNFIKLGKLVEDYTAKLT